MANLRELPARGRIIDVKDDAVTFHPTGTNYQLHLHTESRYDGPVDQPIECLIRVTARKVLTVPSGGLFVAPIFGPPRTIQGRVKHLGDREMVVRAGTDFVVELPGAASAIDLPRGAIAVGRMVNVTALPGARFELLAEPAARA